MSKYRIAWLPGDGVGNDVMECARLVLDKLELDAEYVPGDIGWEFWKTEGEALPDRTIEMMQQTDCALFGAITSKPKEEAARVELAEQQYPIGVMGAAAQELILAGGLEEWVKQAIS